MSGGAPARGVLGAAVGGSILAISTAAILVRLSEAPSLAIAYHRLLYATLALAPFALWLARDDLRALSPRDWLGLAAVGAVLGVHFAAWITSLALTSVAASVVLVTLHPVFVAFASSRLYGEGVGTRGLVGIVLALGGGIVITLADAFRGPDGLGGGKAPLVGDALALLGAAAAAVYFLAGRGYRRRMGLLAYVTPVYASAAIVLGLLLVLAPAPYGGALGGYSMREHAIFLALALVPMILGHTVLNWALKYVSAPVIATTIVGEPVGASLLAFFVLHEAPGGWTLAGGLMVLGGIALVALAEARSGGAPPPPGEEDRARREREGR